MKFITLFLIIVGAGFLGEGTNTFIGLGVGLLASGQLFATWGSKS